MGKPQFHLSPTVSSANIAPDDFKGLSDHKTDALPMTSDETGPDGTRRVAWEGIIPLNIYKRGDADAKAYLQIVQVENADHARRFTFAAFPCWNQSATCEQGKTAVQDMIANAEKDPSNSNLWHDLPTYVEIGAILFGDMTGGGKTDLLLQLTDNSNMGLIQMQQSRRPRIVHATPRLPGI